MSEAHHFCAAVLVRRENYRHPGAVYTVKVVSAKGDYLQVQTVFEGKTIRGYVHREDAFFERPKKDKRPPMGMSFPESTENDPNAPVHRYSINKLPS